MVSKRYKASIFGGFLTKYPYQASEDMIMFDVSNLIGNLFKHHETPKEDKPMATEDSQTTPVEKVANSLPADFAVNNSGTTASVAEAAIAAATPAITTIAQDHALLDKTSDTIKELVKVANFDVDGVWGTAVALAKKYDSDTKAAVAAASDTVDVFQRLGYVLKILGHDVEDIWSATVSAVKAHLG